MALRCTRILTHGHILTKGEENLPETKRTYGENAMEETTLDRLELGQSAVICAIDAESGVQRRLLDLGLIDGTKIETVLLSPSADPKAYRFRGAVIALRNCDAQRIRIRRL